MKKICGLLATLLALSVVLSACATAEMPEKQDGVTEIQALPFPESAFADAQRQPVIGSIVQTGDGHERTRESAEHL